MFLARMQFSKGNVMLALFILLHALACVYNKYNQQSTQICHFATRYQGNKNRLSRKVNDKTMHTF